MKYFLHDCNAFNDEKVSELFLNFGYEGLGLFYTILEKIGSQEKPIKTVVLKNQLKVGKKLDKCWEFMESLGMISSNNGDTFNERILSYSKTYQIKKEKTKEKISQWRENQLLEKNVTGYELNCNHLKVKESKVKESKVIYTTPDKFVFPANGFMPDVSFKVELSEIQIGAAQEYIKLTKYKDASSELIIGLWNIFKLKEFTGKKYYPDVGAIYTHFMNGLKFEKIDENNFKITPASKILMPQSENKW